MTAGIRVRLLLPGREFSAGVIAMLQKINVKFLMPCRNTGNVVAALSEFDRKDRPAVSKNIIENSTSSAAYSIITERKKSGDGNKPVDAAEDRPEKRFIGFATNRPESRSSRTRQGGESRQDTPRYSAGPRPGPSTWPPGCCAFTIR